MVVETARAQGSEASWKQYALQLKRKLGKKKGVVNDWSDDSLHTRVMSDQMPTMVFDRAARSGVRIVDDRVMFRVK